MSKGIDQVRRSIIKRRKLRKQTLEGQATKNDVLSSVPEEEKHGYLPTYFGDQQSGTTDTTLIEGKFNVILIKAVTALALFIGAYFILQTNHSSLEKSKEVTRNILTDELPFARVYLWYQETFGTPLAFVPPSTGTIKNIDGEGNDIALPVNGTITTPFNDYDKGIFITPKDESDVTAWKDGVIIFAGNDRKTNKTVIIQHEDKSKTTYGNLSSTDVHLFQFVARNQMIGKTTPTDTEDVFYFSLQKNNEYIDPFQVIQVDDIP